MTRRLYHDDAYLRRFDAEVVALTTYKTAPAVVLDQTAFYPEAGGQLGDRGRLGGAAVIDTQETDDGAIVRLGDVADRCVHSGEARSQRTDTQRPRRQACAHSPRVFRPHRPAADARSS